MGNAVRQSLLIAIVTTLAVATSAQGPTGIVQGTVRGARGPIASARVIVDSASDSKYTGTTTTDQAGRFGIADVPVGGVEVKVYDAKDNLIATAKASLQRSGDTITLIIQAQ